MSTDSFTVWLLGLAAVASLVRLIKAKDGTYLFHYAPCMARGSIRPCR